jgi:hypothetical protein
MDALPSIGSNTGSSSSNTGSSGSSNSSGTSDSTLPPQWKSMQASNTLKLQLVQIVTDSGARSSAKSELIGLLLTGNVAAEVEPAAASAEQAVSELKLSQELGHVIATSALVSSAERAQLLTRLSTMHT